MLPVRLPEILDQFRRRHDDTAREIPAHVTLLYPFAGRADHERLEGRLRQVLGQLPPLDLRLAGLGHFSGEDGYVLFVRPEPARQIRQMIGTLSAAFPGYPLYEGKHGPKVTPHITLGHFYDRTEYQKARDEVVPCLTEAPQRVTEALWLEGPNPEGLWRLICRLPLAEMSQR